MTAASRSEEESVGLLAGLNEKQASQEPNGTIRSTLAALREGQTPSTSFILHVLKAAFIFFLPSWIHPRITGIPAKPEKIHPTSYLDGLRGVAALIVCWCHMSYVIFHLVFGFGFHGNHLFMNLPFIKLLYGGPQMVAIFFIVSGYSLSLKPLKLMYARSYDDLLKAISSSTLRRPFRLFLPCFVAGFCVLVLVRLGVYEHSRPIVENKELLRNFEEYHQERWETLSEQLIDYARVYSNFVFVWCFDNIYGGSSSYDLHQWTLPLEFRASMVLFLSQFAVARLVPFARRTAVFTFIAFAAWWARWEMILFWAGMLLADIDIWKSTRRANNSTATSSPPSPLPPSQSQPDNTRRTRLFWAVFCILGMYIASYPDAGAKETPGFRTLSRYIPELLPEKHRWWQGWGALMMTTAICNEPYMQRFFTTPPIHYLGKVSYAMYLVHGPVMHSVGYIVYATCWGITGTQPGWYELGFGISLTINTFLVLWVADIFWRAVDVPCVNFARWVESSVVYKD